MKTITLVVSCLLLNGCGHIDQMLKGHDHMHSDTSSVTPHTKTDNTEHLLVRDLVASKPATPLRTTLGYSRYDALYLGASGGCNYVALTNLEFNRHKNFTVCGARITEANQPAPILPNQYEARYAVNQNINSAYLNRTSQQVWQGYRLDSVQIGPLRADGCVQIFTKITHNYLLVDTSLKTVCQGGIQ